MENNSSIPEETVTTEQQNFWADAGEFLGGLINGLEG